MILSEILLLKKDFEQRHENYRQVPTQAEQIRQVNRALAILGRKLKPYHGKIPFTLTAGEPEYDLQDAATVTRLIHRPVRCVINGRPVEDAAGEQRLSSIFELDREYPAWRTADEGSVRRAALMGNRKMMLYRKPTAEIVAAGANFLAGYYLPGAILSNGTYAVGGFPAATAATGGSGDTIVYSVATTAIPGIGSVGNAAAAGGGHATVGSLVFDYQWLGGFDFSAVPDGATINWIRVENFLAHDFGAGGSSDIQGLFTSDGYLAIVPGGPNISVDSAGFVEHGPVVSTPGLTAYQVKHADLKFQMFNVTNSFALDYFRVAVSYEGTGSSMPVAVDTDAKPDLSEELHEALAYIAAELAIEPTMADDEAVMRAGRFSAQWRDAIADMAAENRRLLSPAESHGFGYSWNRGYRGR